MIYNYLDFKKGECMKKFLILLTMLLAIPVQAEEVTITGINMDNMWNKLGLREEKTYSVGAKILNANKIEKRVIYNVGNFNSVNACASYTNKTVTINKGTFKYIDNDDELAAILAHETAHVIDYYDGFGKAVAMTFNKKSYENKADLLSVDYMVKAGYNPVAAITFLNKAGNESLLDWGILWSHPKTSKRLFKIYKYIYVKYPKYLSSDMIKNINYVNWTYTAQKDINKFQQKEKEKASKRGNL